MVHVWTRIHKAREYGSNTDQEPQNCPAAICSPCRDCPRSPCPSCPGHRGSAGCWRWWRGRGPAPSSYPSPGRYCLYPAPSININSECHIGPGVYTYFTIKNYPRFLEIIFTNHPPNLIMKWILNCARVPVHKQHNYDHFASSFSFLSIPQGWEFAHRFFAKKWANERFAQKN